MPASRSKTIFEKSSQAMIAAVEIYNKPDFQYRAETFSILAVNAWELLLKAQVLALNRNKLESLYRKETQRKKDGSKSVRKKVKRSQSGIPQTIGVDEAIKSLKDKQQVIPDPVQDNLKGLIEIRNNAIHLKNDDQSLAGQIHEIASASVINYTVLANEWFSFDWSRVNIFLLPISFVHDRGDSSGLSRGSSVGGLSQFLKGIETTVEEFSGRELSSRIKIAVSLRNNEQDSEISVHHSTSSSAVQMELTEKRLTKKFPWSFKNLVTELRKNFTGFKQDASFNRLKRVLEEDGRYCYARPNNPRNPKGTSTKFYSPKILKEFQKLYCKSDVASAGVLEDSSSD